MKNRFDKKKTAAETVTAKAKEKENEEEKKEHRKDEQ